MKMQNLCKQNSGGSSTHSTSLYDVSYPSWGSSTESCAQQASMSESLSLKMGIPPQHFLSPKQLNFQLQDRDSSSTQSSGQSCPREAFMKHSNPNGQATILAVSGVNGTHGKPFGTNTKFATSMGPQDFLFAPHIDNNHSVDPIQLHYVEPYFGGLFAPFYGPQAMIHPPQMMGMTPARVPLPLDTLEDDPIYVNAKQYRAILRRRQVRAKLEAENKLVKGRKPYLHESRHKHALNRARGSGGRFLNAKKLQESGLTSDSVDTSGSTEFLSTGNISESEVHPGFRKEAASTTSCSDITSKSNGEDIFHQPEFRFSGYPPHIGRNTVQGCSADINETGHLHHLLSSVER
ncbi:nuclear transcription factor Y subunit A-3-like isoform X2 [Mangifera indica]|uniref:nuclear transcription factor Y subunit A-3-like isoform X2 n=1 Tax=Mangifera indica TaxID=29780 RepID=UPI001CF96EB0|nr:nuclear transcription factor Y subunit A-3-like isoform X2 [Mangifera indica]